MDQHDAELRFAALSDRANDDLPLQANYHGLQEEELLRAKVRGLLSH